MSWWGAAPQRWRAWAPWAVGVVVLVAVVWWWWPTLRSDHERLDVLVVADGQVREGREQLDRRVRQRGLSISHTSVPASWCDAVDLVAEGVRDRAPGTVVVSVRSVEAGCDGFSAAAGPGWGDLRAAAGAAAVVVVVQPGPAPLGQTPAVVEVLRSGDVGIVADPTDLLGEEGEERRPCQWWDDCEADGQVAVRSADGALTAPGGERVARVLVAVIP